eukprot:TRINITY_DN15390_c0_g1_i5.p1 TRINITY_DN15390_c0_g1~~TRINITY_DN15390_c0_g1_i5.p1  ORF type:complete len:540 (-),score=176.76 TRINITY_DN15390_c0_g1_i5:74-1693(-)
MLSQSQEPSIVSRETCTPSFPESKVALKYADNRLSQDEENLIDDEDKPKKSDEVVLWDLQQEVPTQVQAILQQEQEQKEETKREIMNLDNYLHTLSQFEKLEVDLKEEEEEEESVDLCPREVDSESTQSVKDCIGDSTHDVSFEKVCSQTSVVRARQSGMFHDRFSFFLSPDFGLTDTQKKMIIDEQKDELNHLLDFDELGCVANGEDVAKGKEREMECFRSYDNFTEIKKDSRDRGKLIDLTGLSDVSPQKNQVDEKSRGGEKDEYRYKFFVPSFVVSGKKLGKKEGNEMNGNDPGNVVHPNNITVDKENKNEVEIVRNVSIMGEDETKKVGRDLLEMRKGKEIEKETENLFEIRKAQVKVKVVEGRDVELRIEKGEKEREEEGNEWKEESESKEDKEKWGMEREREGECKKNLHVGREGVEKDEEKARKREKGIRERAENDTDEKIVGEETFKEKKKLHERECGIGTNLENDIKREKKKCDMEREKERKKEGKQKEIQSTAEGEREREIETVQDREREREIHILIYLTSTSHMISLI